MVGIVVVLADKNLVTNQVIFADKTIFDIFGHYDNYMHLQILSRK